MAPHSSSSAKPDKKAWVYTLCLLKKAVISRVGIATVSILILSMIVVGINDKKVADGEPKTLAHTVQILFDKADSIAIMVAALIFLLETPDRKKRNQYEAWQVVNSAQTQGASGGRIQALQDLNEAGISLEGLTVSRADLSGIHLPDCQLSRANFEEAQLDEAYLEEANFKRANLKGTSLRSSHLQNSNLSYVDLSYADLSYADLSYANLEGANLTGAILTGTQLWDATLSSTKLKDVTLSTENFVRGIISPEFDYLFPGRNSGSNKKEKVFKHDCLVEITIALKDQVFVSLRSADLENSHLNNINLKGADFSDANLQGAKLQRSRLEFAVFAESNLQGADLSKSWLEGAIFLRANLKDTDFSEANLSSTWFLDSNPLEGKNITEAQLEDANLCCVSGTGTLSLYPERESEYVKGVDQQFHLWRKWMGKTS